MSRKKRKGLKSKSDTILLIVENSEIGFFNQYFKAYLKSEKSILIDCIRSSTAGKCEITNGNKMAKKVNTALLDDGYKAVFLMLDLDTKCHNSEQNHNCLVELKREYLPKYNIAKELKSRFYLFVVCNEIESWFLTIDKNRTHTNNPRENHKKEMKKLFNVKSEKEIVEKMLVELFKGNVALDISKNDSFEHFIKKLQEFK